MPTRRGDNIPDVSEYAHWNEDAYAMWYEENKYDMMYADEIIEDDNDYDDFDPDPDFYQEFDSEEEARKYFDEHGTNYDSLTTNVYNGIWYVEGWSTEYMKKKRKEYQEWKKRMKASEKRIWGI